MAYRLYEREWLLSHTVTAEIFAIYPIVVVAVLIGFGDLSDHIGRRATMLLGLVASLAGAVVFAVAPSVLWLFVARALMGVGVGLTVGPSNAAVVEFAAGGASKRAALITTLAQAGGFAAALLVGGALIQYGPWPMHLGSWVLAVLLAPLLAATWFLPRRPRTGTAGTWRPRAPFVPREARGAFAIAALAMMTAYPHGVLVLSLGGEVAHDLVGTSNALVGGAVLSLFAIASGAVGFVGKALPARSAMRLGALGSAASMGLLALAAGRHDHGIYLLATSTAGAGYSLMFLSAIELVNAAAPADQRGGVLSALYLLGYLAIGAAGVVLGTVATAGGLALAVDCGTAAIAALSCATLVLAGRGRRATPQTMPDARPERPACVARSSPPRRSGSRTPAQATAPTK
jgi:MFS family permease